jgi:hypothetical protein
LENGVMQEPQERRSVPRVCAGNLTLADSFYLEIEPNLLRNGDLRAGLVAVHRKI